MQEMNIIEVEPGTCRPDTRQKAPPIPPGPRPSFLTPFQFSFPSLIQSII